MENKLVFTEFIKKFIDPTFMNFLKRMYNQNYTKRDFNKKMRENVKQVN